MKIQVSNESITTVIDLLRHGDVEGGRKYRGQLDDPLSELGWNQLRTATANKQDWQHIITSPLKRCAEFANELVQTHSLPLQIEPEFKEVSFGLWEGKTAEELLALDAGKIKSYWNDPINITPPQGENLLDFSKRIITAWDKVLSDFQGQHVLLVSHAGVMRMIICHILSMPLTELFKLDIGLAKASRIEVIHEAGNNYPRLVFHGSEFI
ncbi:MAG: alpha-ribazole phosphatase family protein [Methylococcales bacterium]